MQGDKYSIDMCSGPIFSKIILFPSRSFFPEFFS